MAQIIDAININRGRFTKFAQEWLTIPPEAYCGGVICDCYVSDVIAVLIENKVFTLEELRFEFKRNKIHIPESIINKAMKEIIHGGGK